MTNDKLNDVILTYVNSSNYEGAIMLTAEWGAGKSFYLKNNLVPFLEKKKIKVIVVSLHGLKSDFEISRAIYVEFLLLKDKKKIIKNKFLRTRKRTSIAEHSKLAAKTIVRGISSFFNVDLSCSEEELKRVYDSIDLSNTLLVFEDVERSKMPVEELLAYVNNLVEYDRIKVVLITHEEKLKGMDIQKYKEIKEKTIGDTFVFIGEPINAIDNMIKRFNDAKTKVFFEQVNKDSFVSKLIAGEINGSINLRSIMFGLEKFNEMMMQINSNVDFDFKKNMLVGCLLFIHKYRKDSTIKWDSQESISTKLASNTYPLYKFIFDFLKTNELDVNEMLKIEQEFKEFKSISEARTELNTRLEILYSCYLRKEEDIKDAILYLKKMLKEKKIQLELYFKIANYLFYIKPIINFDAEINECLNLMIKNISDLKEIDFDKLAYYGGIVLDNESSNEFNEFKNKIKNLVNKNKTSLFNFSYELKDLDAFCKMTENSKDSYYTDKAFIARINIKKLITLIKKCSAEEINKIRSIFIYIYAASNIKDFFVDDKSGISELRGELIILKNYKKFDSIQKHQITMMINNLDEIIRKLEVGY